MPNGSQKAPVVSDGPGLPNSTDLSLGRYVPRIAVAWDEVSPGRQWQELDGTLCFVDISGFTNLSERLAKRGRIGAEELTDILDRIFSKMLGTAYEYGGSLLKFGGDALLLLFSGSEHPLRATSAVVAMQATLRSMSGEPTAAGKIRLRMSVGVHSGKVHLFCVGTSHRELMVTGAAGTITTRMEHAADAGEIVISDPTRERLPKGAAEVPKGPGWRLKWRKPPLSPSYSAGRGDLAMGDVTRWMPTALRSFLAAAIPEPEHRVATVGFVRFCGVDELLERDGSDAVAAGLQEVVDAIQEAADAEGLTFLSSDINEDGGKVIIVAGAPTVQEDDEGRVLRAARRIADSDSRFDLHLGVNRGHVFAGEVGTAYRSTYTVMGDTVNVAARLCAEAWAGRILVTPDVLERSHTLYETSPLEPLTVKGKSEPLVVYELGDELGFRTVATRTELPFVGRTDELDLTNKVLGRATTTERAVLAVIGETGVGKSRLVQEALDGWPDFRIIQLRAEPYGAVNPYRPFRDPLRDALGVARGPQADMAEALRSRVAHINESILPMLPLLGDALHIDLAETSATDSIERRFRQDRLADTLIALLDLLAPDPTVFLVEDAQWMDEASTHLLGRLSEATSSRQWAVVAIRRPSPEGFAPDNAELVKLEPLTTPESAKLVNAATAAAPLRPHEVDAIVGRVGGNPLFIEETIRVVRETGGIEALSDSLGAAVGTRIDALPPLARRILRYSSVLGRSFRVDSLQQLVGADGISIDPATRRELGKFLERDGRTRLRFRNAMTRDIAYNGLSFKRRRELHMRAAESAEREAGENTDDIADLLAMHFSLGREHGKAWHYSRIAGDNARDAYANIEAAANYERALESARRLGNVADAERAAVWIELGDVRYPVGLFDEALDAYRRAGLLLGEDAIARANVLYKRALMRERAGAYSQAMREISIGYRLVESIPTREAAKVRARLGVRRASVRQAQERPAEAMRLARLALEEARLANDAEAEAGANQVLHWTHLVMGLPGGTEYGERALQAFLDLDDLGRLLGVTNNLGAEAFFSGRWDDAVAYYRQGRQAAERTGDVLFAALIGSNIGEVLVNQGRLDEAEPLLRDAARVQRASGWMEGADFAEMHLGRVLSMRGDNEEALVTLERVRADFDAMNRSGSALEAANYLAEALLNAGRAGEAWELIREVAVAGDDVTMLLPKVANVRGRILMALGDLNAAWDEVRSGLIAAEEQHLDYERALLLLTSAEIQDKLDIGAPASARSDAWRVLDGLGVLPANAS